MPRHADIIIEHLHHACGAATAAGGRVVATVSKKTSALVAGDDPGSKLDKARRVGIEIIDEATLLRRVGHAP